MVRSPLTAARATFALKAGEWFRRGRLIMVSPVHGDYRRCQAEIPLIILCRFPRPALTIGSATSAAGAHTEIAGFNAMAAHKTGVRIAVIIFTAHSPFGL